MYMKRDITIIILTAIAVTLAVLFIIFSFSLGKETRKNTQNLQQINSLIIQAQQTQVTQ